MRRLADWIADNPIIAILTLIAFLLVSPRAHATPQHERPRWFVAYVRTLTIRNGNAALAGGELYGPFRSQRTAGRFCHEIPATAARCDVLPVLPKTEWLRKGAR
jgi:hypothetical protein